MNVIEEEILWPREARPKNLVSYIHICERYLFVYLPMTLEYDEIASKAVESCIAGMGLNHPCKRVHRGSDAEVANMLATVLLMSVVIIVTMLT